MHRPLNHLHDQVRNLLFSRIRDPRPNLQDRRRVNQRTNQLVDPLRNQQELTVLVPVLKFENDCIVFPFAISLFHNFMHFS